MSKFWKRQVAGISAAIAIGLLVVSAPAAAAPSDGDGGTTTVVSAKGGDYTVIDPTGKAKWWVEENPPAPVSDRGNVSAQASGGGCATVDKAPICISFKGSESALYGDFYINGWNPIVQNGTARVYIRVNGTLYYHYTIVVDHLGVYPKTKRVVSGSGNAYTIVDFFKPNGSIAGGGASAIQFFP